MLLGERVKEHFSNSIQTLIASADTLSEPVAKAGELLVQTLLNGGKILTCGNDGSAVSAQHLTAKLLNRYEMERPSLPSIALTSNVATLTAIGNGYNYRDIFSKQIYALASELDVLVAVITDKDSENILDAIQVAHEKGSKVIVLNGNNGLEIEHALTEGDVQITVPHKKSSQIHECHTIIIHILCDIIDQKLFGSESF
ncbi:SIS domain-containing protein [Thiotrichales bacterium 19S9-12]|nr:SIS domain-containing protein [Thiotrichales bacterium 19S9-11]MCF6811108.1 SIS domain-containing protein [Thiotrichales bacterium 19S9-12]